jgi:hypothetical protein
MKKQITCWLDPDIKKTTEYGFITNHEWLIRERDRMGMTNHFITGAGKTGLLALFRKGKHAIINADGSDD